MKFNRIKLSILLVLIALLSFQIMGCGSKGSGSGSSGAPTGSGDEDNVATVTLTVDTERIEANGTSQVVFTATVKDSEGNVIANGTLVTFESDEEDIDSTQAGIQTSYTTTTTNGEATATMTSQNVTANFDSAETVTATSGSITSDGKNITLIGPPRTVTMTPDPGSAEVVADGLSQMKITAFVKDDNDNNVVNGYTVTFSTEAGEFLNPIAGSPNQAEADTDSGAASVMLVSSTNLGDDIEIICVTEGISGKTNVDFVAGPVATIEVSVLPDATLTADGTSQATIRAEVKDANDNPVDGETLTFSSQAGILSSETAVTATGVATVTYTAPNSLPDPATDMINVESANGTNDQTPISLTGPQIASISLSVNPASLPADGQSQATVAAEVTAVGGGFVPDGTEVTFEILSGGSGTIFPATATTAGGSAVATLTSGLVPESITIRAEAGIVVNQIDVDFTPGSVDLTLIPNSLLATGEETSEITALLTDASGNPPAAGETVQFILDDQSLGVISNITTSDAQGVASALFTAAAKGGTVTVTATWNTGGVDVEGVGTIEVLAPPSYIQVAEGSPDPATINITGTGGQSTSLVTFDVVDTKGLPVADGYRMDFDLGSNLGGGEAISPTSATTSGGKVSTILRGGTKPGPVSISVTYFHNTLITTTTSQITIKSGQPVGEEFGMFAQYLNVSGLWRAGLEDIIYVNAGDIWGNAVPDNTAISFKTYNTGGFFGSEEALTLGGIAGNTLYTSGTNPEPIQGFVHVTAEANNGGRTTHVTALAVRPSPDNNYVYAATDGGGIYKSTDWGASWENTSRSTSTWAQNIIDPYVNDIAIDPDSSNTIYAATGYLGQGHIYRSLDGGDTWNSNDTEEWNGLIAVDNAILTVLCDDGGSSYVWAGTEGLGAIFAVDGESFQWGGTAVITSEPQDIDPGKGTMSTPTLSSTSQTEKWTVTYVQNGGDASTPVLDTSLSTSQANGTMTDVSATDTVGAETWTITYTGDFPVGPTANAQGTLTVSSISASTITELWTVTCVDGTDDEEIFSVQSSIYGLHGQMTDITKPYSSDNGEVTFYIIETGDFVGGEQFTFNTTADGWQVVGSVSGAQTNTANTNVTYTSDNDEISFTILSGSRFYRLNDEWTFDTAITGDWLVVGDTSGVQIRNASTNEAYTSDNFEVSFTISEGATPFEANDQFEFDVTESGLGYGRTVRDVVKDPNTSGASTVLYAATPVGVYESLNAGVIWQETLNFSGDNINSLAHHPTLSNVIYAGTEDAGVWASVNGGSTWTQYITGLGKGLSASTPVAGGSNSGNGVMSDVEVFSDAVSESWTLVCTTEAAGGGIFSVTGSVSGTLANYNIANGQYSVADVMRFTITAGSVDFKSGDTFTFSTTRDLGRNIKDVVVDGVNNKLYALTYFWGPLEAHAVGNVYVADLDGSGVPGNWDEANQDLPVFSQDDPTLYPQHVMAVDANHPGGQAFYIGGEGINLYKATDGLAAGNPMWKESKSGITNLIMSRMPILFSGECFMSISTETIASGGSTYVKVTVYIQDTNGNPPISGSEFLVIREADNEVIVREGYGDAYIHEGTWRDPSDVSTDDPYEIYLPSGTGLYEFKFVPTCLDEAPGCSGSETSVTISSG